MDRDRETRSLAFAFSIAWLCVHAVRAEAGEQDERPWAVKESYSSQLERLRKEAGSDPAKKLELLKWTIGRGYWHSVVRDAEGIPDSPELRGILAIAAGSAAREPEELARFTPDPRVLPALIPLTPEKKKAILALRDRDFKPTKQSTYFDLSTDLDTKDLDVHSKTLNGYWRSLKNRFRAHLESNVDVFIYGSRDDYLRDYLIANEEIGESVLGFYMPAYRRLVYFDDRYGRDDVFVTATHECTHLLIDISFRGAPIPRWLHEGMACFCAADGESLRGRYTLQLVVDLMPLLKSPKANVARVTAVAHKDFKYEDYPQSWALVHYLNSGARMEKFQTFLTELRERVDHETTVADCSKITLEELEEAFGQDVRSLGEAASDYFRSAFRLERSDQRIDLAEATLRQARYVQVGVDRRAMLEAATVAIAATPSDREDPQVALRRAFCRAEAGVRLAEVADSSAEAWRLVLRSLATDLKALGTLTDESEVAWLIRNALDRMAAQSGIRSTASKPRDLRVELRKKADELMKSENEAARAATYRALAVITDDLLEIAYSRLAAALSNDPLHRRAAREWVLLSLTMAPAKLDEVFPLLLTVHAADPCDQNKAALGLAYIGMGNAAYGKSLLAEAVRLTAGPSELSLYFEWEN